MLLKNEWLRGVWRLVQPVGFTRGKDLVKLPVFY